MPWSTSVAASHSVKPIEACLVTVYGMVSKITSRPAADAMLRKVAVVTGGARAASGLISLSRTPVSPSMEAWTRPRHVGLPAVVGAASGPYV
jgi:hypothetical protein